MEVDTSNATAPVEGTEDADLTAEVEADLKSLEENDPQLRMAKAVEQDLSELTEEEGGTAKPKPDEKQEYEQERSKLAQALKKRNEVHQEREKARQEADQIKSEALRMRAEVEQAARQLQQQAQWLKNLQNDPIRALEAAGINPEEFIFNLAKEGTPEGAQAKELRELRAKQAQFEKWQKDQEEQRQEALRQHQIQQQQHFRNQVETQFIQQAEARENVKLALESGLLSKRMLIEEGDRVADKYRQLTGQEASLEDIIEYIDEQAGKAYTRIRGGPQVKAPVTPVPSKQPVRKTLSQDDGSERRALTPTYDPEEAEEDRKARAAKAVAIVMQKARARGAAE